MEQKWEAAQEAAPAAGMFQQYQIELETDGGGGGSRA